MSLFQMGNEILEEASLAKCWDNNVQEVGLGCRRCDVEDHIRQDGITCSADATEPDGSRLPHELEPIGEFGKFDQDHRMTFQGEVRRHAMATTPGSQDGDLAR
jgi:hypothetical protein